MTPHDWVMGSDTGVSSRTIWAAMMGADMPDWRSGVPVDVDDFGRCHRLLAQFPEWRARMPEVAARFPLWAGIVREWDELTAMYVEDLPHGWSDRMFRRLMELREEAMIAEGWIQTGAHSFMKPRGANEEVGR